MRRTRTVGGGPLAELHVAVKAELRGEEGGEKMTRERRISIRRRGGSGVAWALGGRPIQSDGEREREMAARGSWAGRAEWAALLRFQPNAVLEILNRFPNLNNQVNSF